MAVPKELLSRSQQIFEGKIVNLRVDTTLVTKKDRTVEARREVVEHLPSVVVVPVDKEENVLLVEQYRHATGEALLEAPAGGVEKDETPQQAAARELQEETGYASGRLVPLGGFWIAPGWCTEYMHTYLATELIPSQLPQDEDEDVRVVPVPLWEVPNLIRQGHIRDAKSIAVLLTAIFLSPTT